MGVPNKFDRLGAITGNKLPAGYLAAEFLESTGTQYIKTQASYTGEGVLQTEFLLPSVYGQHCIWGARKSDYTNAFYLIVRNNNDILGSPCSPASFSAPLANHKYKVVVDYANFKVDGEIAKNTGGINTYSPYIYLFAYNAAGNAQNKDGLRLFYFDSTITSPHLKMLPTLDSNGVPCMFDKVTRKPFYNSGTGQFIVGMTLSQARKLSKLPSTGGSLTVSLPWEAQLVQHNAEVEAALKTAKNNGWTITVQYREPDADSAVYNKYAACTTVADMQAVNPNYKRDLTADGEWEYPLNSIVDGSKMFGFYTAYMKRGYFYFPNMLTATDFANGGSSLVEAEVYAPKATSLRYMFHDQRNLKKLSGDFSKLEQAMEFLCNTSITDLEADFPSLVDASYFALNCNGSTVYRPQLNKASVLRILNSIPSYTSGRHRLGIGIHVDNQSDDEVLSAIAEAESKGWTLTVQWNATATAQTASTFGLRKPQIYAKVGTMERSDGTTEQFLDWGHYVTDWEANGYMEFATVEEAKEHFNIGD